MTNAFIEILQKGGPAFMYPLLLLSIVSLAVVLERAFVLWRRILMAPDACGNALALADKKDAAGLQTLLKSDRSLTALVVSDALTMLNTGKGTITFDQALEHSADKNMDLINERFWVLRGISHIAPIIGLLGTVVGLTISFKNIGLVGLNQQSVASGISIALITTVAGLTIALPTIVAEYCLKAWAESLFRKVRAVVHEFAIRFGKDA
jgi:biopolymer transport protein ExbB